MNSMMFMITCSLTTRGSLSRSAVVSLARSRRRHAWSEKVCLCWASTDITAWTNHSSAHVHVANHSSPGSSSPPRTCPAGQAARATVVCSSWRHVSLDLYSRVIYLHTRVTRSSAACHVSPSLTGVMELSDCSRDPHLTAARSCNMEIIISVILLLLSLPIRRSRALECGTRVPRLYKAVSSHAHGGGGGVACRSKWSAGSRCGRATPAHTPGSS